MRYVVECQEVYYGRYAIEADSEEDAVAKFRGGKEPVEFLDNWFSHINIDERIDATLEEPHDDA